MGGPYPQIGGRGGETQTASITELRRDRVPPHDLQAEEHLLGAAMLVATAAATAAEVGPEEFYKPAHGHIAAAISALIAEGAHVDSGTVATHLRRGGLLDAVGGPGELVSLVSGCPATGGAAKWAQVIRDYARERRVLAMAGEIVEAVYSGVDCAGLIDQIVHVSRPDAPDDEADTDLATFIDTDDPDYEWVVPGLLERGDRVILTGVEGGGKSTLFRQMAVQLGAGVHPFTLEEIEPLSVLLVDLENGRSHVRRELRPLRAKARGRADNTVIVRVRSSGVDLLSPQDRRWLEARVLAAQPDVVFIGPIYKMASGDPNEETTGKPIAMFLDHLRTQHKFAVVIEAHSGHASGGGKRPERPFGWSGWLRWPEFGLHLAPEGHLRHWRGDRDQREWPAALTRGGEWPWTAVTDKKSVTFARCIELCREAGEVLSENKIAKALGCHHEQIGRAISANQKQWNALTEELGG